VYIADITYLQYNGYKRSDFIMSRAITVRVDENVKQQAEDMLSEIGLNMTTYINSSLRALVREKKYDLN